MTKVEAIKRVLEDNDGIAIWNVIYNQIEHYYPNIRRQIDWKAGIRGVLYRALGKQFKMVDEGIIALLEYDEKKLITQTESPSTSKSIQTFVRIGQEKFRKELLKCLKSCPITGIDDKRILLASHIKPWVMSSNEERLDVNNGLILSPTIDRLFDKGLITFEDTKEVVISPSLHLSNITRIGIEPKKKYLKLPVEGRTGYLEYHRNNIFISS